MYKYAQFPHLIEVSRETAEYSVIDIKRTPLHTRSTIQSKYRI